MLGALNVELQSIGSIGSIEYRPLFRSELLRTRSGDCRIVSSTDGTAAHGKTFDRHPNTRAAKIGT